MVSPVSHCFVLYCVSLCQVTANDVVKWKISDESGIVKTVLARAIITVQSLCEDSPSWVVMMSKNNTVAEIRVRARYEHPRFARIERDQAQLKNSIADLQRETVDGMFHHHHNLHRFQHP